MLSSAGKEQMGKLDTIDKKYFKDAGRLAELFNINLYGGNRVVQPGELEVEGRRYPSLAANSGEKSRDIMALHRGKGLCYGLEVETESDYSMPERVLVYDACEYEKQMSELDKAHRDKGYKDYREKKSRIKANESLNHVLTTVLYLGEGIWEGRRALSEMTDVDDEVKTLLGRRIQDYNVYIIEADRVNPENYTTDLREFFQALQWRNDKESLHRFIKSPQFQDLNTDAQLAITLHTGMTGIIKKVKEEKKPMCKAVEEWIEEERDIGREEGRKEGRKEGIKEGEQKGRSGAIAEMMRRMLAAGMDEAAILKITQCSKEELAAAAQH
jgi:hypothetical protein